VDLLAAVIANEESLELVQPGEGALDDPAGAAEPGAVLGLASGDLWSDPALAQPVAVSGVVVAAVRSQALGSSARPADAATHRWHRVDERDQLRDVVAVAARNRPGERDPRRVDQQVVLRPVSGSINRARARRGAPLFACT
jgi:hypothetical protein